MTTGPGPVLPDARMGGMVFPASRQARRSTGQVLQAADGHAR
ncbi:hypothetical protein [Micromonospora inyonensis]|nr:hypothetical protein [Micromonospora inyonensis]